MELTLVVMAAGIGSRFGGTKQLAEVGPGGEAFLDFAIDDAVAAGASRVVMIVRTDIEADVRAHLATRPRDVVIDFVCQDLVGPQREKPWGTAHAILAVAPVISGPFMVVNADDYYGESSYRLLADRTLALAADEAVLIAFELGRTLPVVGTVSRGVCATESGQLVELVETHEVGHQDGQIIVGGTPSTFTTDTPVSMNMFGLSAAFLDPLPDRWEHWLDAHRDDPKAEFLLPTVIAEMMAEGTLAVEVATSSEDWIGVTNPHDLDIARDLLATKRSS